MYVKEVFHSPVVQTNDRHTALLPRLISSEAKEDEGLGMLMVGNVGVNRAQASHLDFGEIRNLDHMFFHDPGGFKVTMKSHFYERARSQNIRLVKRVISGERFHPARCGILFF